MARSELPPAARPRVRSNVGELVRTWRVHRRRSQLDLALDVGVSPRHLSFVETGRSRPSPELLLALAEGLDVPLRERNRLLLAAGYAPRYTETALDDPAMEPVLGAVRRLLDAHAPFPAVAVDRAWNVVLGNTAAGALTEGIRPDLLAPQPNIYRLSLHPDGLAQRTVNFAEWAAGLVRQLRRSALFTGDPGLIALLDEVTAYPNVAGVLGQRSDADRAVPEHAGLLVPLVLRAGDAELSFFTIIATLGTPRDITLEELSVELFYPADAETAAAFWAS